MNKLFTFKMIALTIFLLTPGLLMSCAKSPETKVVAANQSIADNTEPLTTPTVNSNEKDQPLDESKIPTVTYCDLMKSAADYDKKVVRVRAIYFNGFEQIYLYDDRCKLNQPPSAPEKVPAQTWAQWDKSFVSKGDSSEAKLNRRLNGFGRKDVTVVGRFDSTNEEGDINAPNLFGHMNCCRYQFSIMRVEKIVELGSNPVKTEIDYGTKVKFAVHQKIDFEDFTLEALTEFNQPGKGSPKYIFRAERGSQSVMIFGNSEAEDAPLKFKFGGENYLLESAVSDKTGRLAADELIIQKVN